MADAATISAACRTESRSAHYRVDFPDADPAWIRTVLLDCIEFSIWY
jgi:succinate dehydrogenase/fumarate reductase flavoprotein subunit